MMFKLKKSIFLTFLLKLYSVVHLVQIGLLKCKIKQKICGNALKLDLSEKANQVEAAGHPLGFAVDKLNTSAPSLLACRASYIFLSKRSHPKKFSHHLEFFM